MIRRSHVLTWAACALGLGLAVATATMPARSVVLEPQNVDAVKAGKLPFWNLELAETANTVYTLRGKGGRALGGGANYGVLGIGDDAYEVGGNVSLTQGACNTLWGSTTNRDVHLYAAWAETQGTSTSNSSPSEDISGGTDAAFKIAVDKNPVVDVTLTGLEDLDSGAAIAAAAETAINAALEAAGQGGRVTVAFDSVYIITSQLRGVRSSVVVTAGSSGNVADNLKLGVANSGVEVVGSRGAHLCVSDKAGLTTVGATAAGAAGYMKCNATLPSTTAVRQIATADLNCTGPVIGTVKEQVMAESAGLLPVSKYGSIGSTATGTAIDFAVPGIGTDTRCAVTPTAWGTGPTYMTKAVTAADKITVSVDTAQASGTSTISYVCW